MLVLVGSILTSCSKSDIENDNQYEKSLKAWLSFKETSNNSYSYVVTRYSWRDNRSETAITVTNGKVTQRHFKNTSVAGMENIPEEALEWIESENDLNTHSTSFAAQPQTLDEIYDTAKTHWLLKRKGSQPTFEAKNNGMISTCGFTAEGCMDDCFDGINIKSIEAL